MEAMSSTPVKSKSVAFLKAPSQVLSLSMSVLCTISAIIFFLVAQPELPLFYTLSSSDQVLAPKEYIFLLPGLSFATLILNFSILYWLNKEKDILFNIFSWSTIVIQVLFLTALVRIIAITT